MDDFLKGLLKGSDENDPAAKWVEWKHITKGKSHCEECLKMDGCWFAKDKKPISPLHFYCHCITKRVPYTKVVDEAVAKSAYSKFDPYLFDPKGTYAHGKNKAFEKWGYTVEDSSYLQAEMERQAWYKYVSGQYTLGKLDHNGQRITIRMELDRKDGSGTVSFDTGWMVYPDGRIQLNTPYGGK